MILSVIVFVAVIMILCICCRNLKIVYPIIAKVIGIIMMIFSSMEYMVKMSGYSTTLGIEYYIYILLSGLKFSLNKIYMIGIFGVVIFLLSELMFIYICKKKKKLYITILGIPVIIFFVVNLPIVGEWLYIYLAAQGYTENFVDFVAETVALGGGLILIFYMIYPYVELLLQYNRTRLCEIKKEILVSASTWGVIDVTFIAITFINGIYNYMFFGMDLLKFPHRIISLRSDTMVFAACICMMAVITFLVIRYAPMGKILTKNEINNLIHEKDESVYMIMHTYKNAFSSISMYANYQDDEYKFLGSEQKRLNMIQMIADEQIGMLNFSMNRYKSNGQNMNITSITDIKSCIHIAVNRCQAKGDIQIEMTDAPVFIMGNAYHITEALVCLIDNACEAVARNSSKRIVITAGREEKYVYIEIYDNGCGIDRHERKNVFKSFYSTKRGVYNYGLGLPYVKNVVNAHNGKISIDSKKGEYTKIQMIFSCEYNKKARKKIEDE